MHTVKERAYAKVNLYLDVGAPRSDGFHSVVSVMHMTGLYDEISVTLDRASHGITLYSEGGFSVPTDRRNLVYRAAELILKRLSLDIGVKITLKKNIPVSAGLAGGSSDAAATLRAMNRLLKRPLSRAALAELAAELGSDVVFCLYSGTALCTGRGEIISPLSHPELIFVIAKTRECVSTKEAYSLLDEYYGDFKSGTAEDAEDCLRELLGFIDGKCPPQRLYNAFEAPMLKTLPDTEALHKKITAHGARYTLMSGSGPSVFGIFDTEKNASECVRALVSEGIFAILTRSAGCGFDI
ncbi:MAG: 4-(cytidine 5'-diphospho)-2-C-methyl-D-erythritol kinase [Clostridia bacterium]|nr:4-(cytidine 5'-diphospho)-2-C-methyl-D-erythritol kinase [Clostridia bacterium]